MDDGSVDVDSLLERVRRGDASALAELFAAFRDRLRRMVDLRMDRRLHGRADPSDVLQEAFLEASSRLPRWLEKPELPFHLWLRFLTSQKLMEFCRRHLGAQRRDARREVGADEWAGAAGPEADRDSLADRLAGRLTTPSRAAVRAEEAAAVRQALDAMDPIDREVLVLRHFEELGNDDAAIVLGIGRTAASNRYVRALKRLREAVVGAAGKAGNA